MSRLHTKQLATAGSLQYVHWSIFINQMLGMTPNLLLDLGFDGVHFKNRNK